MPFVAVTRFRARARRYSPLLLLQFVRSGRQERRTEGNLSAELLREGDGTFWTRSVWQSDASMQHFIDSQERRVAMRRLARWCSEASATHWPQLSSAAPSWPEAHRRLQEGGRPARVDHPSSDHLAYRIAPPDLGRGRSKRFR